MIRAYYKKDEKKLSIKNLVLKEDNIEKIELEEVIVKKDVLYYDNIFGAIKRYCDDYQTLTREEAYDQIHHYIETYDNKEALIGTLGLTFIDTSSRYPIKMPKERLKKLKAEKKEYKRKQKIIKR